MEPSIIILRLIFIKKLDYFLPNVVPQSGPFHEERRFLISEKRPIVEELYSPKSLVN